MSGRVEPLREGVEDVDDLGRPPAVWGHVPLRNPHFVGRDHHLEQLRLRLDGAGPTAVALHGMGGVGKSQTVVEYIYLHASEYEVVWWINAEQPELINPGFVELAERLGVAGAGAADTAVPAVLEALRRREPYRRWLLVFDNADRPRHALKYFPASSGHILVTSRNSEWSGFADPIAVDTFTREESTRLLHRRAGDLDAAEADALAEALGDLPLALEQAAAWHAQTGMHVSEYLELLEQNRTELLEAGTSSEDQLSVAAAWNVPFNSLEHRFPAALQLLQLCAFFGPEPISQELFRGVHDMPEALREALGDPIKLSGAIGAISRYSLAKIDYRKHTLQLHRLVQTVLKNRLAPDEQGRVRHAAHLLLADGDPGNPADRARYAELLHHALASGASRCDDPRVRRLVLNLVDYLLDAGDFGSARDLAAETARSWRELLGERAPDTLGMVRRHATASSRLDLDVEGEVRHGHPAEDVRPTGPPQIRTGLALDVVNYSARTKDDRPYVQRRVSELYDAVVDRLGLDRATIDRQDNGDGIFAFLKAELEPPRVLAFLKAWRDLLHADNERYRDRIRIRMAMASGPVAVSELGFVGEPATTLGRLLDSEVLRNAVVEEEDADLVALISHTLHSLMDETDGTFTPHSVTGRNFHDQAWLWVGRPAAESP
jgi:hypothetical protein